MTFYDRQRDVSKTNEGFVVGDVVRLKSGGPLMTVARIEEPAVYTVWFDGDKKLSDSFFAATLTRDQLKIKS
jgi:uncharacterized protein YodC (DUF2158 family)